MLDIILVILELISPSTGSHKARGTASIVVRKRKEPQIESSVSNLSYQILPLISSPKERSLIEKLMRLYDDIQVPGNMGLALKSESEASLEESAKGFKVRDGPREMQTA